MLASQIIDNGYHITEHMVGGIPNLDKPHSLVGTVKRYLNLDISSDKKSMQRSFIGMNVNSHISDEQIAYAVGDVEHLLPLHYAQQKYILDRGLKHIIDLENKLTPVLVKIEARGCLIDQKKHRENIKIWRQTLKDVEARLDQIVVNLARDYPELQGGKYTNERKSEEVTQLDLFGGGGYVVKNLNLYNVNYASSRQIEDLFDRVRAVKPVDDDKKISFGENAIKAYINNNPDSVMKELLEVLLEYREYSKLISTYGEKFFYALDENGRIRTNYGQCWTDTGRLASSEVVKGELGANLANIPKRKDIRAIFIADPGYSFVDSDLTGQEVLLAGDFSKEPVILKAFKEGFDHHSFLASISYSIIFDKKFEVIDKDETISVTGYDGKVHVYNMKTQLRHDHKSCLFAKFYGGGKMRVMNVLNAYLVNHWPPHMRLEKADEISKALNKALPVLTKFLRNTLEESKRNGYTVANKLGRRRYYDDIEKAHGEIMNLKIQASGADSIKIAMLKIDKWLGEESKRLDIEEESLGWLTMSIYDQVLVCINDKYIDLADNIPRLMAESITYFLEDLKGASDMNIRKAWSK